MERQYIIAIIWLAGFVLCRWMLKAEHEAEESEYTRGDQALSVALSVLSFLMVMFLLIKAWASSVGPYWKKPVTDNSEPVKIKKDK